MDPLGLLLQPHVAITPVYAGLRMQVNFAQIDTLAARRLPTNKINVQLPD